MNNSLRDMHYFLRQYFDLGIDMYPLMEKHDNDEYGLCFYSQTRGKICLIFEGDGYGTYWADLRDIIEETDGARWFEAKTVFWIYQGIPCELYYFINALREKSEEDAPPKLSLTII